MKFMYDGWTIENDETGFANKQHHVIRCSKLFCSEWARWAWTKDKKVFYYCNIHMNYFAIEDEERIYLGITEEIRRIKRTKISMYKKKSVMLLEQLKSSLNCICKENFVIRKYEWHKEWDEDKSHNYLLMALKEVKDCGGQICMTQELKK